MPYPHPIFPGVMLMHDPVGDRVLKTINCDPMPAEEYFNRHLACNEVPTEAIAGMTNPLWYRRHPCQGRAWDVRPAFWYPRPGKQFEITCRVCKTVYGMEVREDKATWVGQPST